MYLNICIEKLGATNLHKTYRKTLHLIIIALIIIGFLVTPFVSSILATSDNQLSVVSDSISFSPVEITKKDDVTSFSLAAKIIFINCF